MKTTSMRFLITLLSLVSAAWAQSDGETENAIKALEHKWVEAQRVSNPDPLKSLLADKFVNTASDGSVTGKPETLVSTKATKWDNAADEGVRELVFGNTAIATGVFRGKGTDDKGKHFEANEHWTDTWVKMPSGQWQCVASHASTIKMK